MPDMHFPSSTSGVRRCQAATGKMPAMQIKSYDLLTTVWLRTVQNVPHLALQDWAPIMGLSSPWQNESSRVKVTQTCFDARTCQAGFRISRMQAPSSARFMRVLPT